MDSWATDTRLSMRARGVMAFLLTRGPGESSSAETLALHTPEGEGRDALRTALKELALLGYMKRRRVPGLAGGFRVETSLHDTDGSLLRRPMPENPSVGIPVMPENPSDGNPVKTENPPIKEEDLSSSSHHTVESTGSQADGIPVTTESQALAATTSHVAFPVPARERLMDKFGQTSAAEGERWQSAWETAGQPEDFDSSIHLMHYLLRCEQVVHQVDG